MKSNTNVLGDISLMAIGYKYNSHKVLGFISTEGAVSTNPGDPYLSRFPDNYSNLFTCPVVRTCVIVRYFNAYNAIYNHNRT